jgi:hypothetical protein
MEEIFNSFVIKMEISEYESILRVNWDLPKKPYPPKVITLPTGEKMVVREIEREEVPILLEAIRPLLTVSRDFYDIVAARAYAELLGWYRYRVRNEYALIGVVNGELVGVVNNRLLNEKTCISLHTIAFRRGSRIGAHLFAAKQENAIENYGVDEILITAESPIGFRRWMVEWNLEPRPNVQHELGGANTWVLTKENYFKVKSKLVFGQRPVPEDLYNQSLKPRVIVPDVVKG